ncbi:MAG TPA: phosphoribosylamine--glycine ligase [Blastocatellia bacterium]|nr:phosphoribosylamine--glycine ligase [Blastocatellia bacterium]
MKLLVIGSGGREHALAWKLRQSGLTSELFAAPGNAGIAGFARCVPTDVNNADSLAELAESLRVDLTVCGPEAPLVAGVAESFALRKLRIVGPSRTAAMLEGSKVFAKQFMERHSIPTARFTVCDSPSLALDAARAYEFPIVVKADGLAAGKGVRIVSDRTELEGAITAMMVDRVFGQAGARVLIEDCLVGREASLMLFTDGRDYKLIAPARDYKRVFDDDQGPNTGGMGSYSVPGLIDRESLALIEREIIVPTLDGMAKDGAPFSGVLYVGLMFTGGGPRVIEYNARLGDPETQAIMMRLNTDLVEIFESIVDCTLSSQEVQWSDDSSVCVVAASKGYPGEFEKGKPINGLDDASAAAGVVVFHAGTTADSTGLTVTSGGRVLGVTARGGSLSEARTRAYAAIQRIDFDGIHYRRDIALA